MAKTWYPVVDYSNCIECGSCIIKCSHGVYDKAKAPSPVVIEPEGCVDHCHGCGELCPVGAITYVGDDTGWTPPGATVIKVDKADAATDADNAFVSNAVVSNAGEKNDKSESTGKCRSTNSAAKAENSCCENKKSGCCG